MLRFVETAYWMHKWGTSVQWSEQELRGWQDRISADVDWMSEIPARIESVGVRIEWNVVTVGVSSAASDAAERILAHHDAPAGMIRVTSDGTGAAMLPYGTVVGRVLLADGRPPGPNDLTRHAESVGRVRGQGPTLQSRGHVT